MNFYVTLIPLVHRQRRFHHLKIELKCSDGEKKIMVDETISFVNNYLTFFFKVEEFYYDDLYNLSIDIFPECFVIFERKKPIVACLNIEDIDKAIYRNCELCFPMGMYKGESIGCRCYGNGIFKHNDGRIMEGNFENGYTKGKCRLTLPDGTVLEGNDLIESPTTGKLTGYIKITTKKGSTYQGDFVEGNAHGSGKSVDIETGDIYDGEWYEGCKHGLGVFTAKNGTQYIGQWNMDIKEGQGRLIIKDGIDQDIVYEGDWENNLWHGRGTWKNNSTGESYAGDWNKGKMHGRGERLYPSGAKYVGDWNNGIRHGRGIFKMSDGSEYCGDFKDDTYDGHGSITHADGVYYEGDWKNGLYHGKGTFDYGDGTTYRGEFKRGEEDGYGILKFANGIKYEGMWRAGEHHGDGKITYSNGTTSEGKWVKGKQDGVFTFSDHGKISIIIYKNGIIMSD